MDILWSNRLFFRYIKDKKGTICFFAGCLALASIVLVLYDVKMEPICYSMFLLVGLGIVSFFRSYGKFVLKYRKLRHAKQYVEFPARLLPTPENLLEEELNEIIFLMEEKQREERSSIQQQQEEQKEYYNTWVHQIKTPIAAMQLILQNNDTEDNRKMAVELFRIEQYVEMVLGYARLGEKVSDFVWKVQSLDEIIRGVIRKYANQFIQKRLRLEYEGTNLQVETDEKWLSFVLEQLISNGIKYTKKGSISIQVTKEGMIWVRDTGVGIAPEDIPRIFEKGFTGYNGHSGAKATGIGLYLARKTAEKLNCKLYVESVVGEGSSFGIQLPKIKKW